MKKITSYIPFLLVLLMTITILLVYALSGNLMFLPLLVCSLVLLVITLSNIEE